MELPVRRRKNLPAQRDREVEPYRRFWRDPFAEFEDMWGRMGRIFEQAFESRGGRSPWVPVVEVDEHDDAYLIRAELPGVPRENVSIEVDEDGISIAGQIEEEKRGETLTRRSGQFAYRASLPRDVDTEKAEATLRDGILTVRLPRTGHPASRRIDIS